MIPQTDATDRQICQFQTSRGIWIPQIIPQILQPPRKLLLNVFCFSNTNAPRPARSFCSTLASSCSGRDGVCSGAPAEGEAHALGDLSNALVAAVEVGLGGRGGMRPLRGRGGDAGGWTRLRDGENVVDV